MFSIEPGQSCIVEVDRTRFKWGGEGRLFRARKAESDAEYCVKVINGATPRSAKPYVMRLLQMRQSIDRYLSKGCGSAFELQTIKTVKAFLPTHTALMNFDDDADGLSFLILRRFAQGSALHALSVGEMKELSANVRHELAMQLVEQLTVLSRSGLVHLDPYPDNIFFELSAESRLRKVVLIDLEGMGILDCDREGFGRHCDRFAHVPTTLGKSGLWMLPAWYERLFTRPQNTLHPYADFVVAAAHWQALCVSFFAISNGYHPFAWLGRDAQIALARGARSGNVDSVVVREAIQQGDIGKAITIIDSMGGNTRLFHAYRRHFECGFADAHSMRTLEELNQALEESIDS